MLIHHWLISNGFSHIPGNTLFNNGYFTKTIDKYKRDDIYIEYSSDSLRGFCCYINNDIKFIKESSFVDNKLEYVLYVDSISDFTTWFRDLKFNNLIDGTK